MNVLIVDRDDECCFILDRSLSIRDYSVTCLHTLEEADLKLKESSFTIMLLESSSDEHMEFLKQVRMAYPSMPVIILSADDSPSRIDKSLDLGVADYIVKPFELSVITSRIHDAITPHEEQVA